MSSIRVIGVIGIAPMGAALSASAQQRPLLLLNPTEIEAIKAKVKSGAEPWKSAASKARSIADGALGTTFSLPSCYDHYWSGGSTQRSIEDRCDYPYDKHLAARGDRFLKADFNKTYAIFECLYLYKANKWRSAAPARLPRRSIAAWACEKA